jgi:hypothetical protein
MNALHVARDMPMLQAVDLSTVCASFHETCPLLVRGCAAHDADFHRIEAVDRFTTEGRVCIRENFGTSGTGAASRNTPRQRM